MRFMETKALDGLLSPESKFYPTISYLEYIFFTVALAISMISLGYHIIKMLRDGDGSEQ